MVSLIRVRKAQNGHEIKMRFCSQFCRISFCRLRERKTNELWSVSCLPRRTLLLLKLWNQIRAWVNRPKGIHPGRIANPKRRKEDSPAFGVAWARDVPDREVAQCCEHALIVCAICKGREKIPIKGMQIYPHQRVMRILLGILIWKRKEI